MYHALLAILLNGEDTLEDASPLQSALPLWTILALSTAGSPT